MIERDKALEDIQHIPWDCNEEIVGQWWDIYWSAEGLPNFIKFLQDRGVNVVE